MSKRLQVTLEDREFCEIQRIAATKQMTVAEWSGKFYAWLAVVRPQEILPTS